MANSEDVLHQYAARLLAGGSTRQDDAALMERLAAEVRELRAQLKVESARVDYLLFTPNDDIISRGDLDAAMGGGEG